MPPLIRAMKRNQTEQSVRGLARVSREEGAILGGLFPPEVMWSRSLNAEEGSSRVQGVGVYPQRKHCDHSEEIKGSGGRGQRRGSLCS